MFSTVVLFLEYFKGNCIIDYVLLPILSSLAIQALSENDYLMGEN